MTRILIIDDDAPTRDVLRQMLEREGYEVVDARDGREGLQRYEAAPMDLVITDLLMPGQEGLETIGALAAGGPAVQDHCYLWGRGGWTFCTSRQCSVPSARCRSRSLGRSCLRRRAT